MAQTGFDGFCQKKKKSYMTFNLVFHHPKTKMQKKLVDTRKMENIMWRHM